MAACPACSIPLQAKTTNTMAWILSIDTATDYCSVALSHRAELCSTAQSTAPFEHSARLTLLIDACLQDAGFRIADLDAVALSRGPGSYTSLRVGAAVAKGICYAADKPLLSIDTLQSLALAAHAPADAADTLYCPMIDARRMEVYTALWSRSGQELLAPHPLVVALDAFLAQYPGEAPIVYFGSGAAKCREVLEDVARCQYREVACSATQLVPLAWAAYQAGEFADVAYFSPLYLKPPNITTAKSRL